MSELEAILAANRRAATEHSPRATSAVPVRRLAVLTCMDARIDPLRGLGLAPGDAHIIRNAGGRATDDALRSLIISVHLLGTREVLVIHHTDCGLLGTTNAELASRLRKERGIETGHVDFLPFTDLAQSVRDDVQTVRSAWLLPRDLPVHGLIYDVHTGRLHEVT